MDYISPFFISFLLVFLSELGDKTQLIAMSFSSKMKTYKILLGVALGSLFSHGVAIIFGSILGNIDNSKLKAFLSIATDIIFIILGIIILFSKEKEDDEKHSDTTKGKYYVMIIALSIAIGELGDKTFLASIGLGISYPTYKLFLVLGAIMGMVVSDFIAIILGKIISQKISNKIIKKISGVLFVIFGVLGIIKKL